MRAPLPLLLPVVAACAGPTDGETRLYLREALPPGPDRFPRTNAEQWDLGSLSTLPPESEEVRACGDVVIFGAAAGGPLDGPVGAVDWDVWWSTGTGRATLALHARGEAQPLAVVREAGCAWPAGDPRRDGNLFRTYARSLLAGAPSSAEPGSLYLAVEGSGSDVRVRSCPAGPSSLVVHRVAPEDPLGPAPAGQSGCALPAPALVPPPLPPPPAPVRVLPPRIDGETRLGDEVIAVIGDVRVSGPLHLDGTTLVFQAGVDGAVPNLRLGPGSSLHASGAQLLAADPALGFRLTTAVGVPSVWVDTVVDHPGAVTWDHRGRPLARGLHFDGPVEIRGGAVRHGLVALALRGPGSRVEGTRFVGNATALRVEAPDVELVDLHSTLDGLFLHVDEGATGLRVRGARIERPRAAGVRVQALHPDVELVDVRVTGAGSAGLAISAAGAMRGLSFEGVLLEACGVPIDPGHVEPGAPPLIPEGVETRLSPELCPDRPD